MKTTQAIQTNKKSITLGDLKAGDLFVHRNQVYIKTNVAFASCIILSNGIANVINEQTKVHRIDGELIWSYL